MKGPRKSPSVIGAHSSLGVIEENKAEEIASSSRLQMLNIASDTQRPLTLPSLPGDDNESSKSPLASRQYHKPRMTVEQVKVAMDKMHRRIESGLISGSTKNYYKHTETIFFVDWDDTLCPSHWIRSNRPPLSYFNPPPNDPFYREPLAMLDKKVVEFLQVLSECGKVVIVTNAALGWVKTSSENFLPDTHEVMKLLKTPCEYARLGHENESFQTVLAKPDGSFEYRYNADIPQNWKALSIKNQLEKFYSQYTGQSWKNVISIGDQLCEQEATKQVVKNRPSAKRCHTKTIKFIECPSISDLYDEISALIPILPTVAAFNGNLQYNIAEDDISSIVGDVMNYAQ